MRHAQITVMGFQYGSWGMQHYGNQQSKVCTPDM